MLFRILKLIRSFSFYPPAWLRRALFSQHKTQGERTGLDESMPMYIVSPTHMSDPVFAGITRIRDNLPHHSKACRSPRRIIKKIECPCRELGVKSNETLSDDLKKTMVSYPILTESVVQDASVRMMLALEDERGESKKYRSVRRNLRRLFSSSDLGSNSRLSSSTRSSVASIQFPAKEKLFKDNKATSGIAGLLIKSIHTVPLEDLTEDHETGTVLITNDTNENEYINQEDEKNDPENEIRTATPKSQTKKEHDSSFEENTPSSNGFTDDSSIASYNILSDSKFSTDEELDPRFARKLRRSDTYPPLKIKALQMQPMLRTDSDTRPLHELSTSPPLVKCLSTNQISTSNLEFTMSLSAKNNFAEVDKNADIPQNDENVDNQAFSLPATIETPTEIDSLVIETPQEIIISVVNCEEQHDEISIVEKCNYTDVEDEKDDEISCANDSEASVSAYSLLHCESDAEYKDKTAHRWRDKRYPSMIEEEDECAIRESFKDKVFIERLEERDMLKSSLSVQSLTSLQQYQFPVDGKGNVSSKLTPETMSKTSSSIESLLQSSGNEIFDVVHKNRQRRMMDLMRIIDTKMMVHQQHTNNPRRKKRNKNPTSRNLQKSIHNQFLKKRMHGYRRGRLMRVSSFSKDFYLNESTPTLFSPDTSSYNSSLESIITHDTLILSHLSKSTGFVTKRSTANSGSREFAAKELTLDTRSIDSFKEDSNIIEMKELKINDTNRSSPASVDHSVHENHSICNIKEDQDELTNSTNTANMTYNSCVSRPSPEHRQQDEASISPSYPLSAVSPMVSKVCQLSATKAQPTASLHRRSSDSDLSITPKGNSFGANDRSMTGLLKASTAMIRTMNQDAFDMLEYPFITMQQYPSGFILHLGGLVSSRSVKLLERISNLEEPESRDAWWKEVRMEVRSHARALACNVVIGYKEETSICDDVCVLNAYGTAAVINLHNSNQDTDNVFMGKGQSGSGETERDKAQQRTVPVKVEKSDADTSLPTTIQTGKVRHTSESRDHEVQHQCKCSLCHLPYNEASVPFRVNVSKCAICKRARVPDVMFTTIELPENLATTGRGCIIQATTCKAKKDLRGELNAKEISDCLPFLEYELHSLLLNKLRVKGMNAIFGLKLQVSVGERLIIGMAVGTAVFLTALPTPTIPQIASGNSWHKEEQLTEIQKTLVETVKQNREFYKLKPVGEVENGRITTSDTDESDDELPDVDFSVGPRDTCVLEVDDIEDMDRISLLMDDRPPEDFHVVNTQTIPGLDDLEIVRNLQMFTQISRTKIPAGQFASMPSKYFARLLQSVYFKLRRMIPCALCDMQFKLALPEPDEIQFTVIGMALGLGEPVKVNKSCKKKLISHSMSKDQVKKPDDSDMIFNLDVDHGELSSDNASSSNVNTAIPTNPVWKPRTRSPLRSKLHTIHRHKHVPLKGRYGVDITPLSYLPGGRIERYLGNLNFFFIRESTSIRENGGLSGFTHSFVTEVLAIVRAHITALGGNAMVAFFMSKCVLLHSPHKNQGQCLINVGGDVVSVSYFADEKHCGATNC